MDDAHDLPHKIHLTVGDVRLRDDVARAVDEINRTFALEWTMGPDSALPNTGVEQIALDKSSETVYVHLAPLSIEAKRRIRLLEKSLVVQDIGYYKSIPVYASYFSNNAHSSSVVQTLQKVLSRYHNKS